MPCQKHTWGKAKDQQGALRKSACLLFSVSVFPFVLSSVVVVMEPTALTFPVKASPPENYTEQENARVWLETLVSKLSCAHAGKLTSSPMAGWAASFGLEISGDTSALLLWFICLFAFAVLVFLVSLTLSHSLHSGEISHLWNYLCSVWRLIRESCLATLSSGMFYAANINLHHTTVTCIFNNYVAHLFTQ